MLFFHDGSQSNVQWLLKRSLIQVPDLELLSFTTVVASGAFRPHSLGPVKISNCGNLWRYMAKAVATQELD